MEISLYSYFCCPRRGLTTVASRCLVRGLQFLARYGAEAECFQAWMQLLWPGGFVCPSCQHRRSSRFQRGTQWLRPCAQYWAQTCVTEGTILAGSKLPLRLCWWVVLSVCYCAAWRMKHKLIAAMANVGRQRGEWVQIDVACLSGECSSGV
ncbi:MAG: transposase [Stenotrophomonas sp.]|uniref:transposase n=1 Tax=Stenotrophomonas sp. TaxID=69392 RepID=UPI003D6CDE37